MQINKTSVINTEKNAAGRTSRNVQSKSAVQTLPSIQTGKSSVIASRSVLSMINAANLPVDKLSSSIITFARFFSLPLKPELMAEIRRQALTVTSGETTQDEPAKQTVAESKTQVSLTTKYRDALSMAAAAAESKGVELQPKALESFAEAVDPELRGRQNENQNRGKKKKQDEQENKNTSLKHIDISASGLEKMAIEYLEKDSILDLLNKLPGKNGQRWIVIPLDFSRNGKECRVSLKILIETKQAVSNRSDLMAIDIVEAGNSKSRISFAAEAVNDKVSKLSVFSQSEITANEQKSLKREMSKLFKISANHVFVQNRSDSFLCAGCDNDLLSSIDEVV